MVCDKTDVEALHQGVAYDRYRITMSDGLTKDVIEWARWGGASATAVLAQLASASSAVGPAGPISVVALGALFQAEATWISTSNDGCGVAIDIVLVNDFVDPNPTELPYHYVQGQEHL